MKTNLYTRYRPFVSFGLQVNGFKRSSSVWLKTFVFYKKSNMDGKAFWFLVLLFGKCQSVNPGYFWHVTDFHYDFSYWTDQFSCNAEVTSPGIYGDYWCDSPWLLVKDSIEAMKMKKSDPDFLLWTGDNIGHIKDEDLTLENNFGTLQNITTELMKNFPNIPTYATLGNHDYLPNNQFPPETNELYQKVGDMWTNWIGSPSEVTRFKNGGFYSVKDSNGLRILGLNTNLYYTSNKVTVNDTDPAGQFEWLDQQLTAAKTNKEKVLITAHIPPGIHTTTNVIWFYSKYNDKFIEIINKHRDKDVIIGMYYGHNHADEFNVYYKSDGTPAFPVFMAPSVTPWRYKSADGTVTSAPHNPGIKLVEYDRDTGFPINIQVFYINLPDSNAKNMTDWTLEYDFKTAYGMSDITPMSLHKLTEKMKADRSLVAKYYKFSQVSADGIGSCDNNCQEEVLCSMKSYKMAEFNKCKENFVSTSSSCMPSFLLICVILCFNFCTN